MCKLDGEATEPLNEVIVEAGPVQAENVAFELARYKLLSRQDNYRVKSESKAAVPLLTS